jgi:predicted nuclease of predicted toxin-antitoxin system
VRFLIDAQLPPALARLLNDRAHVAEHVNDVGMGESPDRD